MANLTITHNSRNAIVVSQNGFNIVLNINQIDSVIKNLELARLEIKHAEFEAHRNEEIRKLRAWDAERRAFNAVYVEPVDTSQVVD